MTAQNRFDTTNGTKVAFTPVEAPCGDIDYRTINPHQFLQDCYDGDGGFLGLEYTFLVADKTENYFNTRDKMSHYINDMVRFITTQFMRVYTDQRPDYSATTDPILKQMIVDIDRRGSNIDEMKKYTTASDLLHGTVFLASGNDGVEGKAPYILTYRAHEFRKEMGTYDAYGNALVYIFEVTPNTYHRYTDEVFQVLTDEKCEKDLEKMEVVSTSPVPTQIVRPIYAIPAYGRSILPVPNQTLSLARQALNLYELRSRMVQIMARQLFDRLVITGEIDSIPEGVTNATLLASETANAQLLSPDANIVGKWQDVIDKFTEIMYEHMRDGGVIMQTTTSNPESGISKKITLRPLTAALLRSVDIARSIDAYVQDTRNLWFPGDNAELLVEYKTDFVDEDELDANKLREMWAIAKESNVKGIQDAVISELIQSIGIAHGTNEYKNLMDAVTITDWKSEFQVNE